MKAADYRRLYANPPHTPTNLTAAEYQAQHGKKVRPKQSESQMQSECVAWFRQAYPQYARLLYSCPNGGRRSKREAAQLVREGATSGVPDLCLAIPRTPFHGLYMELKVGRNKPTPNQVEIMGLLGEQGYKCEIVYSLDEFKIIIQEYLKEERK